MKHVLRQAFARDLPQSITRAHPRWGSPCRCRSGSGPGPVRDFVLDTLSSDAARGRALIDNGKVLAGLATKHLGRRVWGLLSLELWQRAFHDDAARFRKLLQEKEEVFA